MPRAKINSATDLSSREPANVNIQQHIASVHAPANAQKNSDILKSEIEAKLTGEITTHSHPAPVVSAVKNITVSHSFQYTSVAGTWMYLGNDDARFSSRQYSLSTGVSSMVGLVKNDIMPFLIAPKNCKLVKVKLEVMDSNGGVLSLGIMKYKRTHNAYFYQSNATNQVVLLDAVCNGGVALGATQQQHVFSFGAEISSATISEGDNVILLLKSSTAGTVLVECILTAYFEECILTAYFEEL